LPTRSISRAASTRPLRWPARTAARQRAESVAEHRQRLAPAHSRLSAPGETLTISAVALCMPSMSPDGQRACPERSDQEDRQQAVISSEETSISRLTKPERPDRRGIRTPAAPPAAAWHHSPDDGGMALRNDGRCGDSAAASTPRSACRRQWPRRRSAPPRARHRRRGLDAVAALSGEPEKPASLRIEPGDDRLGRRRTKRRPAQRAWMRGTCNVVTRVSRSTSTADVVFVGLRIARRRWRLGGRRGEDAAGVRLEVPVLIDVDHCRPVVDRRHLPAGRR